MENNVWKKSSSVFEGIISLNLQIKPRKHPQALKQALHWWQRCFSLNIRVSFLFMLYFSPAPCTTAVCTSVIPAGLREVRCAVNKLKRCQTRKPKRTVLIPRSRAQTTPKDIPLPPPFRNDGSESFQLWARRYEVIQDAR